MGRGGRIGGWRSAAASGEYEGAGGLGVPKSCTSQLGEQFGNDVYAVEQLVAELGAISVCVDLVVTLTPRPDLAVHIYCWLKVPIADKKAMLTAASVDAKATDLFAELRSAQSEEAA